MAHTAFSSRAWGLALAPLFTLNFPLHALAQASAEAAKPESVTVTGRYEAPPAQMAGFGEVPLARTPLQVTSINTTALRDLGIDTLGEITKLDASKRASQLDRSSVRTDGSRAIRYEQSFATPWLAATWQFSPETMAYASWGQGVETDVTPNRPRYLNPGEPLPALKSTQTEVGLKHDSKTLGWGLTVFDIQRPVAADFGNCDGDRTCSRQLDGYARHRGVEANADTRWGAWSLRGSAMWLQARREGSATASLNGLVPDNVAQRSLRLMAAHQLAALPGLTLQAQLSHEGPRSVLPDNSLQVASWTTTSLSARYSLKAVGAEWLLRAGVDNVFDRRAWQETPYQYGHSYLYPLAPRTWRASLQVNL
ncbi:MAG: hypothetical protein C4K60_19900 [Ideonella sp. MAG2]|nr:MAG: hypothetical protein C4K60_19900 [Ideonella sp. MAG2]